MSSAKSERSSLPLILLAATAVGSVIGAALYTSSSHVVLESTEPEMIMDDDEPSTPHPFNDTNDDDVSIPLNPSIFETPSKKQRTKPTNPDLLQSPRTAFIVESVENYGEVYDKADTRGIGFILKDELIDELKRTPLLHVLAEHPDDPITFVINRIPTSRDEYISKAEWMDFCTSRVTKPNRRSKGLVPEDFRAALDTVD